MAQTTNYKQELIEKLRENYLSVALGILVFLVIVTLIFRSGDAQPKKEAQTSEGMMKKRTYVVKPGDSVSSIARDELGSMDKAQEIIEANKIENPDTIEVGTELTLPSEESIKEDDKLSEDESTVNGDGAMSDKTIAITGDTYTVVKGDFLWDIAVRAYGDGNMYTKIIEANTLRNPDRLEEGTVLKLPRAK